MERQTLAGLAAMFGLAVASPAPAGSVAEYRVHLGGIWNASHVTLPFPASAHFTTLIGDTHLPGEALWEGGGFATLGIERVAEIGAVGTLSAEIDARIEAGVSGGEVRVDGLFSFPGLNSSTFFIDSERPEISLISMVAPSPDWFVGVSGLSLRDEAGWIPQISIDLHAYDAGTENGDSFSLSNAATVPAEAIRQRGTPFVEGSFIGGLHFTLLPEPRGALAVVAALTPLAWLRRRRATEHQRVSGRR